MVDKLVVKGGVRYIYFCVRVRLVTEDSQEINKFLGSREFQSDWKMIGEKTYKAYRSVRFPSSSL